MLLKAPGGSWRLLDASECFWRLLETPGGFWRLLVAFWMLGKQVGGTGRLRGSQHSHSHELEASI